MGQVEVTVALAVGLSKHLFLPYPVNADLFYALIIDAAGKAIDIEVVHDAATQEINAAGGISA